MSSSMRNAIQRREHRERAQPHERRHLGLLEKHKDYSLRAQDYSKKQKSLKILRKKAVDRNEDEFYFGMHSRKGPGSALTRGKGFTGKVEGDRGNKSLDVDTVRLLKTQDIAYVRTVGNLLAKEAEVLRRAGVMAREAAGMNTGEKIVFTEGLEERNAAVKAEREAAAEEDDEEEEGGDVAEARAARKREERVEKLERRLEIEEKKLAAVRRVERVLEVQQAKMAKTATSGGTTRKGKKLMVRKRKR
ncbi:related to cgi-94 protein [Cephalotrichum gorgonifer]|uniref:U3 small nucleolar RNA-associated protein 11 n=1 Tax=Cephalotrichum gorgonifer TaxID=2041049 RepID=A0AAE8MZS9_9PEZI|nr:related to cgi-94 protein [Cephalotrichum gorgonifer]